MLQKLLLWLYSNPSVFFGSIYFVSCVLNILFVLKVNWNRYPLVKSLVDILGCKIWWIPSGCACADVTIYFVKSRLWFDCAFNPCIWPLFMFCSHGSCKITLCRTASNVGRRSLWQKFDECAVFRVLESIWGSAKVFWCARMPARYLV